MIFAGKTGTGRGSLFSIVRLIFIVVFLIGFPVGCLFWILDRFQTESERAALADCNEDLSQITAHLSRLSQPQTKFQATLEKITRLIRWEKSLDQEKFKEWASEPIQIYLFDGHGKRAQLPGFSKDFIVSSERYFGTLQAIASNPARELSTVEKSLAESFSGNANSLHFLGRQTNQLLDLRQIGINKLGGWFQTGSPSGKPFHLLAWVDLNSISARNLARQAVRKMKQVSPPEFDFGWVDLGAPDPVEFSGSVPPSMTHAKVFRQDLVESSFQLGKRLFHVVNHPTGIRLIGTCRAPRPQPHILNLKGFILFAGFAFFLLTFWKATFDASLSLPIRSQITLIFGMAGLISIGALMGFANMYKEARQAFLIREIQTKSVKVLEKIDNSFIPFYGPLIATYRNTVSRVEKNPGSAPLFLRELCEDPHANFLAAYLIDPAGKMIFKGIVSNQKTAGWLKGNYDKSLANVGQNILSLYNYESSLTPETTSQQDSALQRVLARPSENILRRRGTFQTINLAGEDSSNFVELIIHNQGKTRKGKADGIIFLVHDTRLLEMKYLEHMERQVRETSPYQLVALPKLSDQGLPNFPRTMSRSRISDFMRIFDLVSRTQTASHLLGFTNSRKVLMSGISGTNLGDFHLFLTTPFSPIEEQTNTFARNFLWLGFIALAFAIMLAAILGQGLIRPLAILGSGIERFLTMKLDRPVVVDSGDDLDQIAGGINRIMDDLKDLKVAQTIQEQLLPREAIDHPAFRCQGWTKSASQFGGEIFDFLPLTNGQVAFMVGDVSGMGISSALVIAMSKMAIRLFLHLNIQSPGKVLEELYLHFNDHFHRMKQKAFFVGIFNPETGDCRYASMGALYGVLLNPDQGGTTLIDGQNPEPGKFFSPEKALSLKSGSKMVICSDGVVNSSPGKTVMERFDQTRKTLEKFKSATGNQFGEAVLRQVGPEAGEELPEDLTLLVLELK